MFLIGYKKYEANGLPMHRHKTYELISYVRGNGVFHSPDGDVPVKSGSIVVVPPGVSHGTTPDGEMSSVYIMGDFGGIFHLDAPVVLMDNGEREGNALLSMIYRNRHENREYIAALCNALAHFLLRNLKTDNAIELAVRSIVYEITQNFYDPGMDLNVLLNRSGYAEDYIRAQFKRSTGKTPTAFLNDLRIERACYLIEVYHSTCPLAEIAAQCGYTDYVLFSKRFKAVKGVSPRRYKQDIAEISGRETQGVPKS